MQINGKIVILLQQRMMGSDSACHNFSFHFFRNAHNAIPLSSPRKKKKRKEETKKHVFDTVCYIAALNCSMWQEA